MPDYASLYDSILPGRDLPDAIFSLSEDAINDLLRAHRQFDDSLYRRSEEFKDAGSNKKFFSLDVVVGGERKTRPKDAEPLVIKLYDTPQHVSAATDGSALVYRYPSRRDGRSAIVNPSPNVVVGASKINFYLEWPRSGPGGGVWREHIRDVAFTMEAHLDIEDVDASASHDGNERTQTQLKIVPISLFVGQSDLERVQTQLTRRLTQERDAPIAGKVSDLIVTLFAFAATKIGPDLAQTIPLPLAEVSGHDVYPSFMRIQSEVVTIGATLAANEDSRSFSRQVLAAQETYQMLLQRDVEAAGGWDKVLFTEDSLDSFYELPENLRHRGVRKLRRRTSDQIAETLIRSETYAKEFGAAIKSKISERLSSADARKSSTKRLSATRIRQGMAVAINEHFFDSIVADMGNIDKSDQTPTVKVLNTVKGNLGYRVYIGTPDIAVSKRGISGAVDVDAWGGLNYAYREYHKCSTRWSSWKKVGLGIRGEPKLTLKTRRSAGLSVFATFDLSKLKLYTGAKLLDALVGALSKFFLSGVESILNTLAAMLSFVVVPAEFSSKNMNTVMSLSRFSTDQYKRAGEPDSSKNNYLLIIADVEGKKA